MAHASSHKQQAPVAQMTRSVGGRKEDWIANQLRRVYDDALHEPVPQEMLDLLSALDSLGVEDATTVDKGKSVSLSEGEVPADATNAVVPADTEDRS